MRTFTFRFATVVNILAATPGGPFIPDPTTAIVQASFSSAILGLLSTNARAGGSAEFLLGALGSSLLYGPRL